MVDDNVARGIESARIVDGALPDDALASAISHRSSCIAQLGEYWGFAEWLAWGWRHETKVFMLFADNAVDLFGVFATPDICASTVFNASQIDSSGIIGLGGNV